MDADSLQTRRTHRSRPPSHEEVTTAGTDPGTVHFSLAQRQPAPLFRLVKSPELQFAAARCSSFRDGTPPHLKLDRLRFHLSSLAMVTYATMFHLRPVEARKSDA